MENQVTRPIENALTGVSGIKNISSNITTGSSSTTVEFELGTEIQRAVDDVRTAVERTRVELPNGIDPPTVQRLDLDNSPIATYAVSAPEMTDSELAWFIEKGLRAYGIFGRRIYDTWERTQDLLRSGALNVAPILTHRFDLADWKQGFDLLGSRHAGKVVLLP